MNGERSIRWPFQRGRRRRSREPGAALFQGLRVRLTLWYCGVLSVALVLFCVILYTVAQYVFLSPLENGVAGDAGRHANEWRAAHVCVSDRPPSQSGDGPPGDAQPQRLFACFDPSGKLLAGSNTVSLPAAFLTDSVVKTALRDGSAHDIVDAGGTTGTIYRYAVAVPDPTGHGYLGVVVSGQSIQQQNELLATLLVLLIAVGGVALIGAGLGGLFLASRALAPARLAFARQQRFIADASHELRTPLTLMRADAEVLLRGREQLNAEDAFLLEDIVAEANHMSILANNMLTLARLDAETQHREYEVVSLDVLAQQGVQRVQAFAEQKGIVVRRECRDDVFVIGDRMLLEQAMLVLLDNAIKYNRPEGQVTVRTSISRGKACLEVIDTGIGIAAEHLPHLGERFYRVDKARSREAGGTGLGLSIARHIVAAHEGTLTVTSTPGEGTTITILLPLAQTPSTQREDGARASVSASSAAEHA